MQQRKKYLGGILCICGFVLLNCQIASANSTQNQIHSNNDQVSIQRQIPIQRETATKYSKYHPVITQSKNYNDNSNLIVGNNNYNNNSNEIRQTGNKKRKNSNYNNMHRQNKRRRVRKSHYTKIHNWKKTNYYTYSYKAPKWHHHKGYAIFSHPFDTNAKSLRPMGYQKQIIGHPLHILHTAKTKYGNWVNFHANLDGWINDNAINDAVRWLDVPLIPQRPQLPSGCEVTATTMMLKYRNRNNRYITKTRLANEMPRSSNPYYGFVGSPYSASGWWIAPNGLMHLVNRYTHNKALNLTGATINNIESQINKGIPVVVWVGKYDGFPNHALTIYGYNNHNHRMFVNDPWLDRRYSISNGYLNYHRGIDPFRYGALSYRK